MEKIIEHLKLYILLITILLFETKILVLGIYWKRDLNSVFGTDIKSHILFKYSHIPLKI